MSALYVHIPFCAHACPYCDFSFELLRGKAVTRYLDALEFEAARRADQAKWSDVSFKSVFLGGGTPTALTPEKLERIFATIHHSFEIADDAEITVEANPETLTDRKLSLLAEVGVNRISLGVQALTAASLARLGRHHSVERAVKAVQQIRASGIPGLNIDLIFGAPDQTASDWDDTLTRAVDLGPDHISAYGLTIEEGTPFGSAWASGDLSVPGEIPQADLYMQTIDRLVSSGYQHYEISNFARPGAACLHNLAYWTGTDYLGLGPSAHSYTGGHRFANARSLESYLAHFDRGEDAKVMDESLTTEQLIGESIMLGLRMTEGMDVRTFTTRFGQKAYTDRVPVIDKLRSTGFLEQSTDRLQLTRQGLVLADTICAELM